MDNQNHCMRWSTDSFIRHIYLQIYSMSRGCQMFSINYLHAKSATSLSLAQHYIVPCNHFFLSSLRAQGEQRDPGRPSSSSSISSLGSLAQESFDQRLSVQFEIRADTASMYAAGKSPDTRSPAPRCQKTASVAVRTPLPPVWRSSDGISPPFGRLPPKPSRAEWAMLLHAVQLRWVSGTAWSVPCNSLTCCGTKMGQNRDGCHQADRMGGTIVVLSCDRQP